MRLLKEHRHFLKLFGQTDSAQRKALLRTITPGQIKALSEIAHNIIKFRIVLTPLEKVLLRHAPDANCTSWVIGRWVTKERWRPLAVNKSLFVRF